MALNKNQVFQLKYLLPCVALVLTYVVIGQYYTTSLIEKDLMTVTGKIVSINQDKYKHYKYTDDRITICLNNQEQPFYFFDNRFDFFPIIMTKIQIGDSITISHRTTIQSIVGTGSEFKIMKIQKGSEELYSFDQAKQTFSGVGGFTTFAAVGLWCVYFYFKNKIGQTKGST